jgi:hypothetical protein
MVNHWDLYHLNKALLTSIQRHLQQDLIAHILTIVVLNILDQNPANAHNKIPILLFSHLQFLANQLIHDPTAPEIVLKPLKMICACHLSLLRAAPLPQQISLQARPHHLAQTFSHHNNLASPQCPARLLHAPVLAKEDQIL